ncbi:hypothetical protein BBP40_003927 [Aspergillus hancockii]|nr:hypothetical protein BBP40_003927 [Aspergillus hancockii]
MVLVAMGISYSRPSNKGKFLSLEVYDGDCSVSGHWATGLHLLINLLSTLLLGASNYVMQCLGAPSRSDVDQAHRRRKWLDIGTFTFRNFSIMDTKRKVWFILLLLTSTPIHMIYNSVFFSSISTLGYGMVLIPDDLTPSEPLVADGRPTDAFTSEVGTSPAHIQAEIFNGTFTNLTLKECVQKYNVEYNTHLGTLLYVTDRQYFHNANSLQGILDTVFLPGMMLYDYLRSREELSADQVIKQNNLTITGLHFAYYPWKFTAPDLIISTNSTHYFMDSAEFTLNSTFDFYSDAKRFKYNTTAHDLAALYDYLAVYNPDRQALSTRLTTPTHWDNSSWAANITFELSDYLVYPRFSDIGNISTLAGVPVSHCMSKTKDQRCQLFFSPPIAVAVIVSNLIKVVCMYLTARTSRKEILLRVGDALSSFLTTPDQTTEGRCLMSRADASHGPQPWRTSTFRSRLDRLGRYRQYRSAESTADIPLANTPSETNLPRDYPTMLPERKRWFQAASARRWTATLVFFTLCEATSIFLFILGLSHVPEKSISQAWKLGFGKATGQTMINDPHISDDMISLVLLSNTPQLVLSILYFLCNSLLSCMLIAAEYDDYATQRKPLRVSWPRGQQRSTYYLSLPYRYSGPLLVFSVLMHWLLSQSIFFVNIQAYDVHDQPDPNNSTRGCGYSPIAMFICILVSGVALLCLFGLGYRKLNSRMPLATHCSAAISAACHPPPDDRGAALRPVMWGEIPADKSEGQDPDRLTAYYGAGSADSEGMKYAHCAFTSKEVVTPNTIRLYR